MYFNIILISSSLIEEKCVFRPNLKVLLYKFTPNKLCYILHLKLQIIKFLYVYVRLVDDSYIKKIIKVSLLFVCY